MPETPPRTLKRADMRLPLNIDRAAVDGDTRKIQCSFASDAIIDDHWNGPIQLAMDPAAIDLSYAAAHGLPVLSMHARALPVGRVHDVTLVGGRLTGTIQFSASPEGASLFRDCVDGIITDTSIGASIIAVREEPSHLVAIRWRPMEVSLVDRGADPSVGINRAAADTAAPLHEVIRPMPEPIHTAADPAGSAGTATNDAQRVTNIMELARYADGRAPELGLGKLADDYIQCGQPFEAFRGEVWKRLQDKQAAAPVITAPPAELGLTRREQQDFSIVRACNAYLSKDWSRAGFELECTRAIADKLNRQPKGFFIPTEVQASMGAAALQRTAQSAGDPSMGGFVVPNNYRGDLFVEALRAQSVALGLGVRTLPGLQGNVSIPKQTGSATFYWIPEGGSATDGNLTFAQINLSPRTIAGAVQMTRRLMQQSSPAIETLVRQDLVTGAALALDLAIFEGKGAALEPLGILNHASINTTAISTDATPTWAEMVSFRTEVKKDNALQGALGYVTTPDIVASLMTTAKASGQGGFIMGDDGRVARYPVAESTQLTTSTTIIFGDWSQIIVGFWGVLDIKPDEATLASSGGLVLRAFQDADIGIRHAEAFCKGT